MIDNENLKKKIDESLAELKTFDPVKIEETKSFIKKNVPFFSRSALSAYLLLSLSAENTEKKNEIKQTKKEGSDTVYMAIGRRDNFYPNKLFSLLKKELNYNKEDVYSLRVSETFTLVTMDKDKCIETIDKLNGASINGRKTKVAFSNR